MTKETFYLDSNDKKNRLHGFWWLPSGEPKALVQLTHGMAEYIDRYDPFASFMAFKTVSFAVPPYTVLLFTELSTER